MQLLTLFLPLRDPFNRPQLAQRSLGEVGSSLTFSSYSTPIRDYGDTPDRRPRTRTTTTRTI